MIVYNWQHKKWPLFEYEETLLEKDLLSFYEKSGRISGATIALPEAVQMEALVEMMVSEAIKTSEIEGEFLSRQDVMSSIKNNLGLSVNNISNNKKAKGVSALMIAVRNTFNKPLDEQTLFHWHKLLLGFDKSIEVGKWRTHEDPMQVVSGAYGKTKVHFEAPPSKSVPREMKKFIQWFNYTAPGKKKEITKAPIRAAIAHVYFESIHPFEDGNGRIGRAIAEKALSQGAGVPVFLSLSKSIEANKKAYYAELQKAQKSLQINSWLIYFLKTILHAQADAEKQIDFTLKKVRFFDQFKNLLNDRQLRVIKRMFEEGPNGFLGGMNARKYTSLTKVSKATATRDLQYLADINALLIIGGGRSTSYQINL